MVRALAARIAELAAGTRHAIAASEDGHILVSFPSVRQLGAAPSLAELGDDRARYLIPDQIAADASLALVT